MVARHAPLVLPSQRHAMPQDYAQRMPQFDGTEPITTQKHIDKINDFSNLQEVDDDDVKMRQKKKK